MTKIDIVSGFLGAGKTTLIKKIVKEALNGQKVVLIENEFGEIGIDGGFLQDAGIKIREINSGCICCSLVGDFGAALQEILRTYGPDRILIEPSGVGKLSDVIRAVEGVTADGAVLNSAAAVVDAAKCRMYMKNFGEFFLDQIAHAGAIVLSRTDGMSGEKLQKTVQLLREHNEKAAVITTPWEQLSGAAMLEAIENVKAWEQELLEEANRLHCHNEEEGHAHGHHGADEHAHGEDCTCGCHGHGHAHHHADEVFTSWGRQSPQAYAKEELEHILGQLEDEKRYGMVLRAKGMVPAKDGTWLYFDYVPGEHAVREGSPAYTGKVCVIGANLQEEALAALFLEA